MKKEMKKCMAAICVGVVTMIALGGCGQTKVEDTKGEEEITKITIATSGNGLPYSLLDDKQNWTGIDAEMWEEIAKRTGWEIEVKQASFDSVFGELDAKRADVAANCFAIKEERTEKYYASIPYYGDAQRVAVQDGDEDINSIEDLAGKKVGVCSGQASQTILEEMSKESNFELALYEMTSTALADLNLGRLDAVGGAMTTMNEYMKNTGETLKILDESLAASNVGYFYSKTERGEKIKEEVDKVLEEMLEDGTCAKITEKWLYEDMTKYITN